LAVILGNEAHGLPDAVRDDLDLSVRVPLAGRAESLNLAAAAAVLLYETARRRPAPANRAARAAPRAVQPDRPQEAAVGR
jgi:tRNA(Leu) C34 or U34 (ribose-2'-O)-methylase TrmL